MIFTIYQSKKLSKFIKYCINLKKMFVKYIKPEYIFLLFSCEFKKNFLNDRKKKDKESIPYSTYKKRNPKHNNTLIDLFIYVL
jgi:hypothetical protein